MVLEKAIDYFSIKYIFVFLTIYFTFIPFLSDINLVTTITMFFVLLGFISFLYGYESDKYFKLDLKYEKNINLNIMLSIGYIFLLNDYVNGIENITSVKTIDDYTKSYFVENHDSLYLSILTLSLFYIKYFFYAILITKNKILFYLVFISQILLMFNDSTRLVALFPFIVFIIYGYYFGYIVVNLKRVILVLVSIPLLFVVLLLARGKTDGLNYFEIISNIIDNLSYERFIGMLKIALESFQSFKDLSLIVTENFVHIESGIIRIFFMPISRSVWEDKPDSISRLISREYNPSQYIDGGGTVATIYADAFINGHIVGLLLILFGFGVISKIIYNTMKKNTDINSYQKSMLVMFYSLFIFQFLYYFRGFLSEFSWKTILLILIFYSLYKLQYLNFNKKHTILKRTI
jgi:oligosaccharide repeat unit polymerase